MEIDKLTYKNIDITVHYNKETSCFSAYSLAGSSNNKYDSELGNVDMGYKTPKEAIKDVKLQIDTFINNTPKSYKELADTLTEHLTWTGYEDCHLDEQVIEIIVGNFIKLNK